MNSPLKIINENKKLKKLIIFIAIFYAIILLVAFFVVLFYQSNPFAHFKCTIRYANTYDSADLKVNVSSSNEFKEYYKDIKIEAYNKKGEKLENKEGAWLIDGSQKEIVLKLVEKDSHNKKDFAKEKLLYRIKKPVIITTKGDIGSYKSKKFKKVRGIIESELAEKYDECEYLGYVFLKNVKARKRYRLLLVYKLSKDMGFWEGNRQYSACKEVEDPIIDDGYIQSNNNKISDFSDISAGFSNLSYIEPAMSFREYFKWELDEKYKNYDISVDGDFYK